MTPQEDTRWRLLMAGAEVFAEAGFRAATTREISRRAGVNLAAIHYHFGDKAGLYREVFRIPFLEECNVFAQVDVATTPFAEAIAKFYQTLLPTNADEEPLIRMIRRLHAREESDPSGVLGDMIECEFSASHKKLEQLICRELGLTHPDADVARLAFAIIGLASVYFHGRCFIESMAPELVQGAEANAATLARLPIYAEGLLQAERTRRATAAVREEGV